MIQFLNPRPAWLAVFTVIVALSLPAPGADKNSAKGQDSQPPSRAVAQKSNPTPLEQALSKCRQGDKAGAVEQFLKIDWKAGPAFSPKSPLSVREKDLPAMSAPDREKLLADVLAMLKDLKQLASAVKEKGVAAAATDQELARRCFAKLDRCGTALDSPESLKILQLTARSLRKMAAVEAAKLGK